MNENHIVNVPQSTIERPVANWKHFRDSEIVAIGGNSCFLRQRINGIPSVMANIRLHFRYFRHSNGATARRGYSHSQLSAELSAPLNRFHMFAVSQDF